MRQDDHKIKKNYCRFNGIVNNFYYLILGQRESKNLFFLFVSIERTYGLTKRVKRLALLRHNTSTML